MRLLPLFAATFFAFAAQETPFRVAVNLVNVSFIVRDAAGALTGQLSKDDFELYEDGVKQDIRFFSRSTDIPLRLGLLVDASESQSRFMKVHRRDIDAFATAALTPRDRALLVCFGNHVRLAGDFSPSADSLMNALDTYDKHPLDFPELDSDDTRSGGTALFDAVYLAASRKMKAESGARKALILFSDGEDNSSAHDLMDAIEAAQSADALIYTVRYTEVHRGRLNARNRYGIREMDRLAHETGGATFDAAQKNVGASLGQIADELRSMYDIGYVSTNPDRDGSFRKVTIRATRPGLTVRSRPGYYAR